MSEILSFGKYKSNAELIVACRDLGYLDDEGYVWDSTYGLGRFWTLWRPKGLVPTDIDPMKSSPALGSVDFTNAPFEDRWAKHVVFDPPYRLNGTPDRAYDDAYGIGVAVPWQDRMDMILRGVKECARVLGDGYLLVKCQSQVCSGKIRWQTYEIYDVARKCGLELVDELHMESYRPQPKLRKQKHARRNFSTMQIYKRPAKIDVYPLVMASRENEGL